MKFWKLSRTQYLGFTAIIWIGLISSPFAKSVSLEQKICTSQASTPEERVTACDGLIAAARSNADDKVWLSAYLRRRSEAFIELKEYDRALSDASDLISVQQSYVADYAKNALFAEYHRYIVDAYYWRAQIWANNKFDFDRSIADYDSALKTAAISGPVLIRQKFGLLDIRYQIYLDRASAWYNKGDYQNAVKDLNNSIRFMPNELDKDDWKAKVLSNRGNVQSQAGNFDQAYADYSEAMRLEPTESSYVTGRANVWLLRGDLIMALADHDKAIKLRTKGSESLSYASRGDTYRYKGDFDKAIDDYNNALSYDANYAHALTGRGLANERKGDVASARADFQSSVARGSEFEYMETARARLAAFDSGKSSPVIPAAVAHATSKTSIPTPSLASPSALQVGTVGSGRRVALVIGNSAYANVPQLPNPQKDAAAVAALLKTIGFEVVTLSIDLTREKMIEALRNFANEAERSDWAMVYYAGHGMEVGGVNYLVPVDAKLAVDRDIQFEAVPLNQVLNAADSARKIKLIMLDACRDNPFKPRQTAAPELIAAAASTAGGPITTRSTNGRGLAQVKVTGATLVVYAAKDGQVALDGEGGNSPFAIAVVQRLVTPGVEINKVFRLVRDDVMEATAGRQEPYTYGSLPGKEDFFFVAK